MKYSNKFRFTHAHCTCIFLSACYLNFLNALFPQLTYIYSQFDVTQTTKNIKKLPNSRKKRRRRNRCNNKNQITCEINCIYIGNRLKNNSSGQPTNQTNAAHQACALHSWPCLKLAKAVGLAAHERIGSGVDSFTECCA